MVEFSVYFEGGQTFAFGDSLPCRRATSVFLQREQESGSSYQWTPLIVDLISAHSGSPRIS